MKANELMIGDLILTEEGVAKVMAIAQNGIYFEDSKGWGVASFDRIKPIPITPEILEKNGFKEVLFDENGKESDNGHPSEIYRYDTARSGYILEIGIYDPNFILIQWKEFGIDGWETGELASFIKEDGSDYMLHELQHALRLCRIEKEITL